LRFLALSRNKRFWKLIDDARRAAAKKEGFVDLEDLVIAASARAFSSDPL